MAQQRTSPAFGRRVPSIAKSRSTDPERHSLSPNERLHPLVRLLDGVFLWLPNDRSQDGAKLNHIEMRQASSM